MRYIILLYVMMMGLSACNTMEGLGTDITRTGEGIEEMAR